jgi:transcriptional/translational regulatory protein YebC/TACO1
VFTKYGGNLGSTGSVSHMFNRVGEIVYKAAGTADQMLEAAIEAGADDVESDANGHVITCAFDGLGSIAQALEQKLGTPESVRVVWKPSMTTELSQATAETVLKLIAALEEDDDVQAVFSNFEVDEAVLAKLTAA